MRDFYDVYILQQLYGKTLEQTMLQDALWATVRKRGTEQYLSEAVEVIDEVENSPVMQRLWAAYQKKFSYAADVDWSNAINTVRELCKSLHR